MEPRFRPAAGSAIVAVAIAGVLALVSPQSADAQPSGDTISPEAKINFDRGLERFNARDYEAAVAAFEAAFEVQEHPSILFALAQAERLSGDCPTAVELYRRFLSSDPPDEHRVVAEDGLSRCERALASKSLETGQDDGLTGPAAASSESLTRPGPVASSRAAADTARYQDIAGGVLLGLGVASIAAGGTYFVLSRSDASAARSADTYQRHLDLFDRAESRRTIAWIGLGTGGALTLAAMIRYLTIRPAPDSTTVSASVLGHGLGLVANGRF